jgi:hypothetical protein
MTGCHRNFIAGVSLLFTVNLEERRLRLSAERIDELGTASRETRRHHLFTIEAIVL